MFCGFPLGLLSAARVRGVRRPRGGCLGMTPAERKAKLRHGEGSSARKRPGPGAAGRARGSLTPASPVTQAHQLPRRSSRCEPGPRHLQVGVTKATQAIGRSQDSIRVIDRISGSETEGRNVRTGPSPLPQGDSAKLGSGRVAGPCGGDESAALGLFSLGHWLHFTALLAAQTSRDQW